MENSVSLGQRLTLLEQFPHFSGKGANIPFTYELFVRENCRRTIERYDLDSRMKGLTDSERILALLEWVSGHFCQDGSAAPPWPFTPDSMVEYCETHQNSTNCQGLAAILAGLLRAYGIPAKSIYCMPAEHPFADCHVVVHAYSAALKQWILLDPSYCCVVFDENGNYLDLPGLRQAYIQGRHQLLHTWDKFHHPNPAEDFPFWLGYMAKNTFRFSCTLSHSGCLALDWKKQVELIPDGYQHHSGDETVTSDSRAFWAFPDGIRQMA